MALEAPICTSVISRLGNSEINLAALGIILSFATLLQSPVLKVISLVLIFVKDPQSYLRLRRFVYFLCGFNCLIFLTLIIEPFYSEVTCRFLGLKPELKESVRTGLLMWSIFPLLMGMRRFHQGLLLYSHQPKKIALGTFIRLTTLTACVFSLPFLGLQDGILIGVTGFGCGMLVETLVSGLFARGTVCSILTMEKAEDSNDLTNEAILKIFIPLCASSFVAVSGGTILSAFVARGDLPIESLALLLVVYGLLNPFTWSAFATQDTAHAIIFKGNEAYLQAKQFSMLIGLLLSLILLIVALTPISNYYYLVFNHLPPNLFSMTPLPTILISLLPFSVATKSFFRGVIISRGKTKLLLFSESFEIVSLTLAFIILISFLQTPAINLAIISLVVSSYVNLCFLWLWERRDQRG